MVTLLNDYIELSEFIVSLWSRCVLGKSEPTFVGFADSYALTGFIKICRTQRIKPYKLLATQYSYRIFDHTAPGAFGVAQR